MRLRLLVGAVVAALLVAWNLPATAQLGGDEVRVKSNFFQPFEIRVARGATVTWVFDAAGHTATADDGRFDFDGPGASVPAGQSRTFTFGTSDEVVRYYCRNHGAPGAGMYGYVLVGDAVRPTPVPTPPPPPPPERDVPSAAYPSIQAALSGALPRTIVNVAPGIYREGNLRVQAEQIVVRGTGDVPDDVVVDATGRTDGFIVTGPRARIENLTVRDARRAGVSLDGVAGGVVERVEAHGNDVFGVSVVRSPGAVVRDSVATGSGEAGFSVRGCANCDVIVERVRAEDNAFGFEALNAGGLAVRDSAFESNATGVVLGTWPQEQNPPQRGVHLWRNVIASNNGTDTPRRGLTETVDAPDGVGVWVAGGWFDTIQDNTVSGHARYGIAVSWLAAPALAGRILRNTVSGSETADLAWDGIGADVCFSGNSFETSVPQGAEDLYPCGPLPTVGVPQPQVTADILGP